MNSTLDKIKEIEKELSKIPNIKKILKEKFCSNLQGDYNDLIIILPEKFRGAFPNYDWIIYDRYARDMIFFNKKMNYINI